MYIVKHIIKKYSLAIAVALIFEIINSLTYVYAGYSLSFLLEGISSNTSVNNYIFNGIKVLVIWIIALIVMYISDVYQSHVLCLMRNSLRDTIANKIASLDYKSYVDKDTGNYVSWLTNDVTQISSKAFANIFVVAKTVSQALFALIALFIFDIRISITCVILFIFISVIPQLAGKGLSQKTNELSSAQESATEKFKEIVQGYLIYYASNRKKELISNIQKTSVNLEKTYFSYKKGTAILGVFSIGMSLIGQVVLLLITVILAAMQAAPLGAVLAVGNLGQTFFANVSGAVESIIVAKSSGDLLRKFDVESNNNIRCCQINDIDCIKLSDVSYAYKNDYVINKCNFDFYKGKNYALIGSSGVGKSTLGKIIAGFLTDYEGTVIYGNINGHELSENALFEHLAYVDQNVFIFGESIRYNITLGQNYDDSIIWEILKKCNMDSYVKTLDGGLDYILSENGKNLSGGQRQRIALARALIRNVNYIILDEGTSALDEKNAAEIENTLINDDNITLILITHHLRKSAMNDFEVLDMSA